MAERKKTDQVLPLAALALAWLIPGAGHVYLGRPVRGGIIFLTIAATFWAGMAMGGVMTVDKQTERWWFVADMFAGVHGLVGWRLSERVYHRLSVELEAKRRFQEQKKDLAGQYSRAPRQALRDLRRQYFQEMLARDGLALAAPTDNVARAYAGVASLLNLLCIFDAVILALMRSAAQPPPHAKNKRQGASKAEAT